MLEFIYIRFGFYVVLCLGGCFMDLLIVLYDFVKYDKYLFDIFLMINIIDIG